MADVFNLGFRAGFLRRALALAIDALVIITPFQLLAALLYVPSGGAIQATGTTFECHYVQLKEPLNPPAPARSNLARECRSSIFGFVTSRTLIVGGTLRTGHLTRVVLHSYNLADDAPSRRVFSLDWLAQLTFVAYLVAMEHRTGTTLGKCICRVSVVSWTSPGKIGIPLLSAAIRQLAKWLSFVPVLAFLLYEYWVDGLDGFITGKWSFTKFIWLMGVVVLWYLINFILIITKRDPIYDRLARVAVLCE